MTNKLSEEIVAHTLCISQSLIGKTRLEITQDRGKGFTRTLCCLTEQSDSDASILFFISEGISFGCYFPTDVDCRLVSIPLARKEVEIYRNYCNSQYEIHETADDGWYNTALETFIRIFFDMEENSYMLSIMGMKESDSYGVN